LKLLVVDSLPFGGDYTQADKKNAGGNGCSVYSLLGSRSEER
jgi:hypothetical protein